MRKLQSLLLTTIVTLAGVAPLQASSISLTTVLTGDQRPDHPDDLAVIISVLGDTDSNVTQWTVDLDMPRRHSKARLDRFAFNLLAPISQYSFGGFNLPYIPSGGSLQGTGGTPFMLTLDDPAGNKTDASNIASLTFTVTKTSNFTLADLLTAPVSCSADAFLGCSQMGVHLQGLGANGKGSGAALGNYPGAPITRVPEPATLTLMIGGLAAAALAGRRRKRAL